jgi:DNA-binding MarR family transcriptional regulator
MSPEEIARLHQFRDGFTLVDYAEVGLPVFRLTIEALTTSRRAIPTIQEFVMRALALDVKHEDEIARMLGLGLDIVQATVNTLVSDGLVVRQAAPPNRESFRLSESGEKRLADERLEELKEEMLVVDYDGIRRLPIRLAGESVRRASELKSYGALEIRPYPAEPPSISELAIPEVARVIRRQGGGDFRRTVLALKRAVRRNNVFREAVALVFAADRGSEIQIAFAIDGKLSEQHERAFAEHSGPKKMGFVKAIAEGQARHHLQRLVGKDVVRSFPGRSAMAEARCEQLEAEAGIRAVEPAAQGANRNSAAAIALRAAQERLSVAKHNIQSLQTRPLACYEIDELLDEALANASRSLVVTSAGLQPLILNGHRLREVDRLVEAGVDIRVETNLTPSPDPRGGNHYDPLAELTRRAIQKRLSIQKSPKRELYFLIQDQDLAVVSNRPFLGEVSRRSGFVRVDGLVTRRPEYVRLIRDALIASTAHLRHRA